MKFKDKQENDSWQNQCGIYGYINTEINEIVYIGQTTTNFRERDRRHRTCIPKTLCDRKIQKYPQKYEMVPIESFESRSVTNDFLNPIEQKNVKKFNTFRDKNPHGLNLTSGGNAFISSDVRNKNISLYQNTTGFRWVLKITSDRYSQGYYFCYSYHENGKRKLIRSVDIKKLKMMVKQKNLPWEKLPGEYNSITPYEKQISPNIVFPHNKLQTNINSAYIRKGKCSRCKRGFIFRYCYYDENGKHKTINSVDLEELEKKVKAKNLPWEDLPQYKEIEKYTPYKKNTTEYYHVSKIKRKNTKQGFTFSYSYTQDGKRKTISNVNIKKLEEEVKKRGLIWEKIS